MDRPSDLQCCSEEPPGVAVSASKVDGLECQVQVMGWCTGRHISAHCRKRKWAAAGGGIVLLLQSAVAVPHGVAVGALAAPGGPSAVCSSKGRG